MRRWRDIILAAAAVLSFSLIVARWVLPVMGLAGVEGDLVQPLARSMPALVTIFTLTVFALGLIMHRQGRAAGASVHRLADEAGRWDAEPVIDDLIVPVEDEAGEDESSWVLDEIFETGQPIDVLPEELIEDVDAGRASTKEDSSRVFVGENGRITGDGNQGTSVVDRTSNPFERARPHQLPPVLPEFSGRRFEQTELLAAHTRSNVRILALLGMGGVGKTTLAVRVAHTLAPEFPDARIYVDLRGAGALPLPVADAQAMIIRAFLPAARLPENEADLSGMYKSVLSGKRILLLLDNASGVQQILPLLPSGESLTIVTSRHDIEMKDCFSRRLDVLPGAEAREMLRRTMPGAGDHSVRLTELCGRLPLAIRLAAGAVAGTPDLPVESYVEKLERLQKSGRVLRPIDAVIETSYELLGDELKRMWRSLGVFTDSFDLAAAASLWQVNPARASALMDRLLTFNLVERNNLSRRFRLHDLMSRFADDRLTDAERSRALYRHSRHYQSVLHEADALYEQGGDNLKQGLDLVDLEWHNIQAGQTWAAMRSENDRAACELCNSFPDAGRFVLDLRQHPRERIRWSEAALAASKILRRRKSTARHLAALGASYSSLSEIEQSIRCYEQALDLARAIPDRPGEADALSGLGTVFFNCGDFDRAREYHNSMLEIARRTADKRREAVGLGYLAETILAVGEAGNARAIFEHQLKVARRLGDRRTESFALGGLGLANLTLGDPRKALDLVNQQLTITREIGDRRGEAAALSCIGNAAASLSLHHQAIKSLEQALSIAREIVDRRNEAAALGGLGTAYFLNGDVDVALQFFEQQLSLARETGDRRAEAMAMIGMGEACNADDDAERAAELLREALTIARRSGDVLGQADSLFVLSQSLDRLGDRNQAIQHARMALELFEFVDHPKAGTARRLLIEWTARAVAV